MATEPTTIRLNIEGTDLTISVMVDREEQTISAVISDDCGHMADACRRLDLRAAATGRNPA